VPAAAVTPAPIAYIKVAAVKKLVVGFLMRIGSPSKARPRLRRAASFRWVLSRSVKRPSGARRRSPAHARRVPPSLGRRRCRRSVEISYHFSIHLGAVGSLSVSLSRAGASRCFRHRRRRSCRKRGSAETRGVVPLRSPHPLLSFPRVSESRLVLQTGLHNWVCLRRRVDSGGSALSS